MFSLFNKKKVANTNQCLRIPPTQQDKPGYYINDKGEKFKDLEECLESYNKNDGNYTDVTNELHKVNGGKHRKSAKRRQKKSKKTSKKTMGGKKRNHKKTTKK